VRGSGEVCEQMGWRVARAGVGNVLGNYNVDKLKSIGEYSEHNLILLQRDRDRGELMLDAAVRSEHRSGASSRTIRHGTVIVVVVGFDEGCSSCCTFEKYACLLTSLSAVSAW
jgi:hypothetical protein